MAIWMEKKVDRILSGRVRAGTLTKELLPELEPGSIAVLQHSNLDVTTAESLVLAGVQAVVNAAEFITGQFPAGGARVLLEADIPLFEIDPHHYSWVEDGVVAYIDGRFFRTGQWGIPCRRFNLDAYKKAYDHSHSHYADVFRAFANNTLSFAVAEKEWLTRPLPRIPLRTPLEGRHVLVVIRGPHHMVDLHALKPYITAVKPVLIGVDGGADALIHCGYSPDIIVGDMDSVSQSALLSGAEIVVHSYTSGHAPGLARMHELGLPSKLWMCHGTSEDAALLLADEHGAERIIAVGTHTGVLDFLEKGRPGMGSSLLVRIKLGGKLIDAKGYGFLSSAEPVWGSQL
ncbi:putative cytokinetic ring protein SteA [Paenibacillus sp. J2TS4]|uniref:putative cytokinetic ring protein SteA n=1 Tax=Paenibacillus sp. J2TS4 TaxID=2807194 RepID=UPI001B01C8BB|nr:putative cytokinetic ring protein SteA [Paenibacillus sp. J2TS4]GIP32287.1 thiamin pyrophosphokinase [Paenibacillus sp. J2TS4]